MPPANLPGGPLRQDLDVPVRPVHADPLAVADQAGGVLHAHDGGQAVLRELVCITLYKRGAPECAGRGDERTRRRGSTPAAPTIQVTGSPPDSSSMSIRSLCRP